jgi:hypothetical protein
MSDEEETGRYLVTPSGRIHKEFFGERPDIFESVWISPIYRTGIDGIFGYVVNDVFLVDQWHNLPFKGFGEKGN